MQKNILKGACTASTITTKNGNRGVETGRNSGDERWWWKRDKEQADISWQKGSKLMSLDCLITNKVKY